MQFSTFSTAREWERLTRCSSPLRFVPRMSNFLRDQMVSNGLGFRGLGASWRQRLGLIYSFSSSSSLPSHGCDWRQLGLVLVIWSRRGWASKRTSVLPVME